jgi:hypothetical protein
VTEPGPAARRVRVTSPRVGRPRPTTIASEIDAQSAVGEVYMRSLMRAQLRLALTVTAVLLGTVGLLPLLFASSPAVRHAHLLGVPLPWLVLGVGVYPVVLALAWLYLGRSERIEERFADLVGSHEAGEP